MAVLSQGLSDLFAQYYTDDLIENFIQKDKFKEFDSLFKDLDRLSKEYDTLLTQLELERKGSKTSFLDNLFGKIYKGTYNKETKTYNIRKKSGFLSLGSENAAKNLAKNLINSTSNDLLESRINEVYKNLMDTFLKSLEALMEFTQEVRGTESFNYLIAGVTPNKKSGLDELKYLATLNIEQMHDLFTQTNVFAIQHDPRTGKLVFKLNEGITSNQLLQLIGNNGDVLQGQALQNSQSKKIFDLLRGRVKAENESYIGSDRLVELIKNPTLINQLINFGENGDILGVNETALTSFRFHEDTVSLLAGSDIMSQGNELSVKTQRSTIGFQITSIDQILNALFTLSSEKNILSAINYGFNGGNLQTALMNNSNFHTEIDNQVNNTIETAKDNMIDEIGDVELNVTIPIG